MAGATASRRALRWAAVLGVNLGAAAATLVLSDAYLRSQGHEPYVRTFPGQAPAGRPAAWARADPVAGWVIAPSFMPGQINPQGFRDSNDLARSPRRAGARRVVVLGDSFVVGADVGPDETLPARLRARLGPGHDVFNVAAMGWGVDQMYLAFEHYRDLLDADVVLLVFIDDDIRRVLEAYRSAERLTKPVLAVVDGAIVRREAVSPTRTRLYQWLGASVTASFVAREYLLATEAAELAASIFTTLGHDMARRGGRTVVARVPTRDDGAAISRWRRWVRRFEARFAGTVVDYVDAAHDGSDAPWPPSHYVENGHLSAAGIEHLASLVSERVRAALPDGRGADQR